MDSFVNISLYDAPTDAKHVITVGYAADNLAAKVHGHAIGDVTGLTDALSARVTQTDLDTTLESYVTGTGLADTLTAYATTESVTEALTNFVTADALNQTLNAYATISAVNAALDSLNEAIAATYATQASLAGYSVTSHQHTVEPVEAVPASGIITLARDKTQYVKTITGNTVIGFNASALNLGASDAATFELLIKMGAQIRQVLFGGNVTWLNGEEPYFNAANRSYLFAFRTYDGGNSWVGAYQGSF